ncbi:MAG: methyltransferase domain-containing protein [Candidatus Limnocylindrales bacterium]
MPATPDDRYSHGHHESVLASHRARTAQNSAAYLLPHLAPGQRLLDVGCGPGTITLDLAARVSPAEVVALDREPAVLAEVERLAAERGAANVTTTSGDVYALAFADDSFDVVHAHQVLQHLSDPVAALAEMRRVTREGGIVAARDGDYAGMSWYPLDPRLERWSEIYHAVARANGAEPDAGRRLLAWAHAAGFDDVTPSASAWVFADEASRRWWGRTWAERTVSSAVAEQAVAGGIADREELEDVAAGWRDWAAHPDAWFGILHGEILARP